MLRLLAERISKKKYLSPSGSLKGNRVSYSFSGFHKNVQATKDNMITYSLDDWWTSNKSLFTWKINIAYKENNSWSMCLN